MCEAYKAYFSMPVGDQDKPWAPHFTCEQCKKKLWKQGHQGALPQAGLATADQVLCGEEQRQVGATGGPPEGADATTAHQIGPYATRAVDKESAAFKYLQDFFPKLSEAKIKASVFVGPQIKKILECNEFAKMLTSKKKAAWNSFVAVVSWAITRSKTMWSWLRMVKNYGTMGCRMSLKVHILDAHLDKFKENMGAYSEEQECRACPNGNG
ncbi:uncharacterized protein LOC133342308 isoform X2 [Lethenteron reissneri]|uniref:uncharacterized protein LOC133342308 isoform X2 n=1 Tax=Lethenteron reissneri TaxID=7753 RepID=UPI002AB767B3|nr:uncharacterized protein LOC133342308 isoform X2 [Lethenteron reissneri]